MKFFETDFWMEMNTTSFAYKWGSFSVFWHTSKMAILSLDTQVTMWLGLGTRFSFPLGFLATWCLKFSGMIVLAFASSCFISSCLNFFKEICFVSSSLVRQNKIKPFICVTSIHHVKSASIIWQFFGWICCSTITLVE